MPADGDVRDRLAAAKAARTGKTGAEFAALWLTDPVVLPPSAVTLGCKPLEADPERGFCRNAFTAGPQFHNPGGQLQGGIIAAMLDDTMAVGGLFKLGGDRYLPTLEMKTSYTKPAVSETVYAEGWLVHAGRTIAFLEGRLLDADGDVCARSSATALIRSLR